MTSLEEAAEDFLAQKQIAVIGVSHTKDAAANFIYRKLKETGHRVFAVNPNAKTVEGDKCYPNLKAIRDGIDGVVVVTRPEVTEQIVRDCVGLKISRVWMHRSIGNSVSDQAVKFCQKNNITIIPGGCPMMFCEPVDFPHKCLRWFFKMTSKLPN